MANVVAELIAVFGIDTTELTKGVKETEKGMETIGKKATKAGDSIRKGLTDEFQNLIKAALPFASVTAAVLSMTKAQQGLFDAQRASKELGIPAQEYAAWGRAAERLGYSAQDAQSSIAGLQSSLQEAALTGRSQAAGVLTYLGVSLYKANGQMKTAGEVLKDLSKVFKDMPIEKARVYGQMMGLSPNTIALLKEGKDLTKELNYELEQGFSPEQTKRAWEFQKSLNSVKQAGSDLSREVFVRLAPSLIKLMDAFRDISRFLSNNSDFILYGAAALLLAKNFQLLAIAFQFVGAVGAKAILAIGTSIRAHPILAIISAIIGALYSLSAWFKGESSVIGDFFESFGVHVEDIKNVLGTLKDFLKGLFSPFIALFSIIDQVLSFPKNEEKDDQGKEDENEVDPKNWNETEGVKRPKIKRDGETKRESRYEGIDDINRQDKEEFRLENLPNQSAKMILEMRNYSNDMHATQKESMLPPSVVSNRNSSKHTINSQVTNDITINAPSGNPKEITKAVQTGISGGMSDLNGLISNFETGYISK